MTLQEPMIVDVRAGAPVGLTIPITTGAGRAPTPIAAFDLALLAAGIGNANLLTLSSVIPPGSRVTTGPSQPCGSWGDRLYVVLAERREVRPGVLAVAGLGWVQAPDDGAGLFVEIAGDDETSVVADLERSLGAMTAARPDRRFGDPEIVTRAIRCEDQPVCALVAATYAAEGWPTEHRTGEEAPR